MIPLTIANALAIINKKLEYIPSPWEIFTSCALALHGLDCNPNDIDILTTKQGALIINELLKEYEVNPVTAGTTEKFKSYLGKFTIGSTSVEVMGNLEIKSCLDNQWHCLDHLLVHPEITNLADLKLPIASLNALAGVYEKMNRQKDQARIDLLKKQRKNR